MKLKELLEKKINEKQKKQRAKIAKKVTAGAIAGIAAGIVGGVLLAPKSGKETRDDIAKTAIDLGENAITKTVEIKETLDNKAVETKMNVNIAKEKISKYLSDKKIERENSKNKAEAETETVAEENKETDAKAQTEE